MSDLPKLYAAGPMSGMKDWNFPAFAAAAAELRAAGYEVENPAEGHDGTPATVDGWTWEQYLRRALRQMLLCDAVATVGNWQQSKGARLEVNVARQLSMQVEPVEHWLERAQAVASRSA